MSKQIRVEEPIYERLKEIMRPMEPFSNVIKRLLDIYDMLMKVEPIIRGQHDLQQFQREQREKQAANH